MTWFWDAVALLCQQAWLITPCRRDGDAVWLRQQVWLMQAVVVDLHATSLFIIITRCRRYGDSVATSAGVANAGHGPACDVAIYYYYS